MKKIKITDTSTLVPGPFATHLIQKYIDCEIIKFEDINQPDALSEMKPTKDGIGIGYNVINQAKHVIKVDFRKDGIERIKKAVIDSDVFIENFKRGRAYKLGLGYADLIKINPALQYYSITGFSSKSSLKAKSAHDLNILALCGYLDQQIRLGNSRTLPPLLIADIITAYHTALIILANTIKAEKPVCREISMYEAITEAMTLNNQPLLMIKKEFSANDYLLSGNYPCYGIYETKDNSYAVVAAIEKPLWIDFCTYIGREDLIEKQFDRGTVSEVAKEMKKYIRDEWLSDELDFCVSPVISVNQAALLKYV